MCVCVRVYKFSKLVAGCIIHQRSELLRICADLHRNQPVIILADGVFIGGLSEVYRGQCFYVTYPIAIYTLVCLTVLLLKGP